MEPMNNAEAANVAMQGNGADGARIAAHAAALTAPVALVGTRRLFGRNRYFDRDVIVQTVRLTPKAAARPGLASAQAQAAFHTRFAALPAFPPDGALRPEADEALRRGSALELLLEGVLAIESAMAYAAGRLDRPAFALARPPDHDGVAELIWETRAPALSERAGALAIRGVCEAYSEAPPDAFRAEAKRLLRTARRDRLPAQDALFARAALRRGAPFACAADTGLRIGWGRPQRRLRTALAAANDAAATQRARDPLAAARALEAADLPVFRQHDATSLSEADRSALELGYPLDVAGDTTKKGARRRKRPAQPAAAPGKLYEVAPRLDGGAVGDAYRLVVIDGRLVAAAKLLKPRIVGDGVRTVAELISALNEDPLRDGLRRFAIRQDANVTRSLTRAGLTADIAPAAGRLVFLSDDASPETGGVVIDVTDRVHPDNRDLAIQAASALGLSVAGVDLHIPDIARSYTEGDARLLGVDPTPDPTAYSWPLEGAARDVAGALFDHLFPVGDPATAPIAMALGGGQADRAVGELGRLLATAGRTVVVADSLAVSVAGLPLSHWRRRPSAERRHAALRAALEDPALDALALSAAPRSTLEQGLLFERIAAGALLRPSTRTDPETYRAAAELLIAACDGPIVVDVDAPFALAAAEGVDRKRLILVATNAANPALAAHREAGGVSVTLARRRGERRVAIRKGAKLTARLPIASEAEAADSLPAALRRRRLIAAAMGLALGLRPGRLRRALGAESAKSAAEAAPATESELTAAPA